MGERLLDRARTFHDLLKAEGLRLPDFRSQILPVPVGGNEAALEMAQRLRRQGLLVTAIRPPTVPRGTARLRLSVTLSMRCRISSGQQRRSAGCLREWAWV